MTILAVFAACSLIQGGRGAPQPTSGPVPFILSGNRVYAQVAFTLPGGAVRKTFVYIDLGSPAMVLSKPLFDELHVRPGGSLDMRIGRMTLSIDGATVSHDTWLPFTVADKRTVEGVLPAGVLQRYQVILDYARRMITLAQPGTLAPVGTAVPIRVNEQTGLVTIDATIDGAMYPMAIDNGSGYTWIRRPVAQEWLTRHPDWVRGTGAVGPSNMRMADDGIEAHGILVRIPDSALALNQCRKSARWRSRRTTAGMISWTGTRRRPPSR